jgi:hypothetical protein
MLLEENTLELNLYSKVSHQVKPFPKSYVHSQQALGPRLVRHSPAFQVLIVYQPATHCSSTSMAS